MKQKIITFLLLQLFQTRSTNMVAFTAHPYDLFYQQKLFFHFLQQVQLYGDTVGVRLPGRDNVTHVSFGTNKFVP